jgi:hypothetical protein
MDDVARIATSDNAPGNPADFSSNLFPTLKRAQIRVSAAHRARTVSVAATNTNPVAGFVLMLNQHARKTKDPQL